ncbi:hypothetical protein AB3R30_07250 [Leptolyngbyaceae cyanobacterium UHCC 1019]
MPTFAPDQLIVTQTPTVVVEAGLQPGKYTFQLIVEDEAGNQSVISEKVVEITARS